MRIPKKEKRSDKALCVFYSSSGKIRKESADTGRKKKVQNLIDKRNQTEKEKQGCKDRDILTRQKSIDARTDTRHF